MNYNNHSGGEMVTGVNVNKLYQCVFQWQIVQMIIIRTAGGGHGRIYMGSQVYPHAFWSIAQEAYAQSDAGAVTDRVC